MHIEYLALYQLKENEIHTRVYFIQGKMNKLNSSSHFIFSTQKKLQGRRKKWSKNPKRTISCDQKSKKKSWVNGHKRQKKISTFFLNKLPCIFFSKIVFFYSFTFVSLHLYCKYKKKLLIFFTSSPSVKNIHTHAVILDHSQLSLTF